jgi:tRNA dimethylallyltransferase
LEKEGLESLRMELKQLDPESYYSMDIANRQRVVRALEVTLMTGKKFSSFKTNQVKNRPFKINKSVLSMPREELYDRINGRVDMMFDAGLVAEVESLRQYRDMPALQTVGYKEIFEYFDGKHSLETARELIKRNSRRYAKKQISYFKRG